MLVAPRGLCDAGTSAIPNLAGEQEEPSPSSTRAKWDTDGDVYHVEDGSFGASSSTWKGRCNNTEYEGRFNVISGDAPTAQNGTDGVWHLMSASNVRVEYGINDPGTLSGSFTFELRRLSDSVIILTDAFTMDAEVTTP